MANPPAMYRNRHVTAALCAAILSSAVMALEQRPLIELLENRLVKLEPRGLGGHAGECLRVTVRNNSATPVHTSIPVGWVFTSQQPEVQDLIVTREEVLAIAGGASRSVTCRAFCCEAGGSGPDEGEVYRPGHLANAKLLAVAQAIARGEYDDDIAQNAVWVLSDGNDIASLGAMDSTLADTLRLAVSRISGQAVPLYTVRYAEEEGRVCSPRPVSIHHGLRYTTMGTEFTAVVLDRQGHVVRTLHDRTWLEPGTHNLSLDVDVDGWPPGIYSIQAYSTDRAGAHRMPFTL